jgi:two-component system, cell cycle sensor histidine kinase and response regulator CckA
MATNDAVARLAGGVAHDLNNILAVILGSAEVILEELPEGDPLRDDVQEIRKAGARAVEISKKLLALSGRQALYPRPLDLNEIISSLCGTLGRLLGEGGKMVLSLDPTLGRVSADRGQIELGLIHLVSRAVEDMPAGGRITIATKAACFDAEEAHRLGGALSPGMVALVSVSDTGPGLAPEALERIFEPFFDPHGQGQGAGLTLATVKSTLEQSGGAVRATSAPGRGTTFTLALPLMDAPAPACRLGWGRTPAPPPH